MNGQLQKYHHHTSYDSLIIFFSIFNTSNAFATFIASEGKGSQNRLIIIVPISILCVRTIDL